jgi:hypothetical protein
MERIMKNSNHLTKALFLTALLATVLSGPALGQSGNPRILLPDESFGGYTQQEWHASYVDLKFLPSFGYPPANPNFNSPAVHFLPVKRNAVAEFSQVVPAGKAVMVMVAGMLDSDVPALDASGRQTSGVDRDVEDWKKFAKQGLFSCTIDGVPVPNLQDYVFKSKLAQKINASGKYSQSGRGNVAYDWSVGIHLILADLSVGNHVIHVYNRLPEYGNYKSDLTYNVKVEPRPASKRTVSKKKTM